MALINSFFSYFKNKRILVQIYFIFFIFLNIIDFLNIIGGDLDFFKKLLSWFIIAYIFYSISLSKIFIGIRLKMYDLMFIIAFSFIAIPKSLFVYSRNIINLDSYYIFHFLFDHIKSLSGNYELIVLITSLIGILFSIVLVISMISNYSYKKNSFLGSFNLKDNFLGHIFSYITLILYCIFFGIIVFNIFMEWFALAVDSIILVLGLIYYLIKYVHNHTKFNTYLISSISNSGNNFFKNLIQMFSNKKTFFIGISFLLVLHLLVDAGVYMVPNTIGTQNTLYFAAEDKIPLFNLNPSNFENSQFYLDMSIDGAKNFYVTSSIFLIYFIAIFLGFSLLCLPFFILYKNVEKKEINFNKFFLITFLSSIFFYLFYIFLNDFDFPLGIKPLKSFNEIRGVDIYTNSIINSMQNYETFLFIIILYLLILIFMLFKYDKYKFYYKKLTFIFAGLFFITYIFMFFYSFIGVEYNQLNNAYIKSSDKIVYLDENSFLNLAKEMKEEIYEDRIFRSIIFNKNNIDFKQKIYEYKENSYHFIYGDFISIGNSTLYFNDYNRLYIIDGKYNFELNKIESEKFEFIYYNPILSNTTISDEDMDLVKKEDYDKIINKNLVESFDKKRSQIEVFDFYFKILRFVYLSLFYVLGSLTFIWFYTKKNVLDL